MSIQWFPGHMTRARREIEQKLRQIDLVMELLDARIPLSSRNPMIDQILRHKPRLILLNKADLADPAATREWADYFRKKTGAETIAVNSTVSGGAVKDITEAAETILSEKREARIRKGMNPRAIRALIVGIPNVGKSTLINTLAGRKIAATGDRPGVTKGQQWIKVGKVMELLDTPGILWPKFEDPEVGFLLAATGAIREEILDLEEVAFHTLRHLIRHYPERLTERFQLDSLPEDPEDPSQIMDVLEEIGKQRGCLRSGGVVDVPKASGILLREMRAGKLGNITLERPPA